jgi:putative membrane protein
MVHASDDIHAPRLGDDRKATEHLANERTFLAWVRTSISVTSLGFVVAKFGLWLRDLGLRVSQGVQPRTTGMSLPIGVAMMAFGGILALLAVYRFHKVNQAIEAGSVGVDRGLVVLITAVLVLLALVMIAYVLLTVGPHP